MPASPDYLALALDRALASTGTVGHFLLLNDTLLTNASVTVDAALNTLTTATPHGLVTGTRIRLTATGFGSIPTPLLTTVDYFVNAQSTTVLRLHATLADAVANTNVIDLTSAGSSVVINEQLLKETDRKEVLIAHELTAAGGYTRKAVTALGAATASPDGKARKPLFIWAQQATGAAIVFRHLLFIDGGTTAIGNTTGTIGFLQTNTSATTIADGQSLPLSYQFGHEN